MSLEMAVNDPDRVLSHGEHEGYTWVVMHNNMGFRCGYVRLPLGHPWHGKLTTYLVNVEVHGGITYAGPSDPRPYAVLSHVVALYAVGDDDGWWIGFDCAHGWDAPDPALPGRHHTCISHRYFPPDGVRSQEYVEAECRSLCEEAAAEQEASECIP